MNRSEKIFTKEVALQFLADCQNAEHFANDGRLSGYTQIQVLAARVLAKHQGNQLRLSGIRSLSVLAAHGLAKYRGADLWLDGLTELPTDVAKALKRYEGQLHLDSISSLSGAEAECLATTFENLFDRKPLPHGDPDDWPVGGLHLGGITELSGAAARGLANHCGDLYLNNLVALTDEAAQALGGHRGGELHLERLSSLSDSGARALAKHDGFISLCPRVFDCLSENAKRELKREDSLQRSALDCEWTDHEIPF